MELLIQLDASRDVAAGLLQSPHDLGQSAQTLAGFGSGDWSRAKGSSAARMAPISRSSTESRGVSRNPLPGIGRKQPFPGQAGQGLTDRGSADTQFSGNG